MTLRIKAFDTIDHDILLSKLHLCGISGVIHKCFSPFLFLHNHTQTCFVNLWFTFRNYVAPWIK